jgi:predicted dehydrogenase
MTQKQICVGIVGANPQRSWANVSHVPAINGLSGLRLAAVATRNEQSARKAAEAFGADRWFSDPLAMIGDDQIDVITISVNVPAHRELVLAALRAGKAVYCEAPLGRTVAEAEEMATGVGSLHTAIGLQGRLNPAVRRAAELLSSGKIGRPLNARIVSATTGFGPEIHSSHDLFKLTDTGGHSVRETPDHIDVLGKTRSGAVFTADISGGVAPEDARFTFEIRGSEGWLSLTGGHPYGFQAGDLKLASNISFARPEEAAVSGGLMDAAINVAEVYAHLVRDMHSDTYTTPGFEHALHNARLIAAVRRAAERGKRQTYLNRWRASTTQE